MKNLSKSVVTFMIVLLVILSGVKFVNAASSNVGMSLTSSSKLVAGQTITVNVNYNTAPDEGIKSVFGTLNFDSNVLEYIESTDKKADWDYPRYSTSKVLGIERNNATKTTGTIAVLKFKVKENITADKTTITYNINDVGFSDYVKIDTSVTIYADKAPTETPATTVVNNEEKNQNVTNNNKNTTKKITASTSNKKHLKAGDKTVVVAGVAVVVLAIAVVAYAKYSKNKDVK